MQHSVNITHGDDPNTEPDMYMVSPNQCVASESFDSRAFKKLSSNVDDSYKNPKEKTFTTHGICSSITRPNSQYGINNENDAVEV
jgi:hypothetical protein